MEGREEGKKRKERRKEGIKCIMFMNWNKRKEGKTKNYIVDLSPITLIVT